MSTPASEPRPPNRARRPRGRLLRWLSWHRRRIAVLFAVLAVAAGINTVAPRDPPGELVVVAARELTGGQPLTSEDLQLIRFPRGIEPQGHLSDPRRLIGRLLMAPASRGTPLTELSVVSARAAGAAGRVLIPVRLSDAGVAGLLHVGDILDVLSVPSSGTDTSRTLARGVRLSALPATVSGASMLGGGDTKGVLLLLECTPAEAPGLAQYSGQLAVLLR